MSPRAASRAGLASAKLGDTLESHPAQAKREEHLESFRNSLRNAWIERRNDTKSACSYEEDLGKLRYLGVFGSDVPSACSGVYQPGL
jgi:hypothetical protein